MRNSAEKRFLRFGLVWFGLGADTFVTRMEKPFFSLVFSFKENVPFYHVLSLDFRDFSEALFPIL